VERTASENMLTHALSALERGWSVVPMNGKRPIGTWRTYQQRRMTVREARAQFSTPNVSGLGLILGAVSDACCIDYDGTIGKRLLGRSLKTLPKGAPRSLTGSGGLHVIMRCPPGLRTQHFYDAETKRDGSVNRLRAGELRGEGSLIVLPPSQHPNGNPYRWLIAPTDPLPQFPQALMELLLPLEPEPLIPTRTNSAHTLSGDIATTLLHRALEAATSGGRNQTGFWLACQLRDNDIAQVEAQDVLRRYAAAVVAQGSHPYLASEALASVHSAYSRSKRDAWDRSQRG
jgi:hypothetical protein